MVGEDQPLCPDLPELDLSELDVSDLDADSFLGGLKWYSDQSEIISAQYGNEASNLFEVRNANKLFFFLNHSILYFCAIAFTTASQCRGAVEHLCCRHIDFILGFLRCQDRVGALTHPHKHNTLSHWSANQIECTAVTSLPTCFLIAPKYKSGDNVRNDKPGRTFVPCLDPGPTVGSFIKT